MSYEAVFFIMIESMKKMGFDGFFTWFFFICIAWVFLIAISLELSKGLSIKNLC